MIFSIPPPPPQDLKWNSPQRALSCLYTAGSDDDIQWSEMFPLRVCRFQLYTQKRVPKQYPWGIATNSTLFLEAHVRLQYISSVS